MTPLANRAGWDLQAAGSAPGSARGFLGAFGGTALESCFSHCKMETTSIISSLLFICSADLRAVHVLGWVLLPVSPRSMQGILGAPPQDKTARTTITARSWHRRGEDCFQPSQPKSGGTNDRYNRASGVFFTFICLGKDVSGCSQPLCRTEAKDLGRWGREREKRIELPSKETCIIPRNALCQLQRSYWECSLFSDQHVSFAKGSN